MSEATSQRTTPAAAGVVLSALLLLLVSLLAGCATPQTAALASHAPPGLPRRVLLTDVPFFAQEQFQCGPASLAMALNASGLSTTPEALQPEVYLPAREGSLQAEMLATARRHGRLAVTLPPRLDAVLAEIADGRPVIVLQNLSLPIFPMWHYAVATGYDLDRREIVLNSGLVERQPLPLEVFERTWARSGYWAMVAVAPERLPRSPAPDVLLAAAVALERVDPRAALPAYDALTRRAPSLLAWIGLGNAAYATRDPARAAIAFGRATRLDPASGDAWNNLANALLALGRRDEARSAALRAIALGGPRIERYRETLTTIEQAAK
ncbi:MAG: PA2778 family cysteine peptidase [Gemmatimonadota bacterium]